MNRLTLDYFSQNVGFFQKVGRRFDALIFGSERDAPDFVQTPHNKSFFLESDFQKGYGKAILTIGRDYRIPWRVHQAVWAAQHCLNIDGSFVELGTGKGFIMQSVLGAIDDWNMLCKCLFLFDTFEKYEVTGKVKAIHNKYYADSVDEVESSFRNYERVHIVKGDVLDTIEQCPDNISFLHVDLNDADTEVILLEKIFGRVSRGGVIILDDYANRGEETAYAKHNSFFGSKGYKVLTTPSGQGIVIKR
jgi:O-methyltransferase